MMQSGKKTSKAQIRLVDSFMELFYYTLFLKSLDFGQFSYEAVVKHYKELLRKNAAQSKRAGFSRNDYETALFAVCAWIDETVMNSGWQGKGKWSRSPFQLLLFKTTNAGVEFFERLENLTGKELQARLVYDYCLTLGFKGKYYQSGDSGELKKIMSGNLKRFTGSDRVIYPDILFPESYGWLHQTPPKRKRFAGRSLSTIVAVAAPVIMFLVVYFYFRDSLADIMVKFVGAGL